MNNFLETYQSHIIYTITVIFILGILTILTYIIDKWFNKKESEYFQDAKIKPIKLLKLTLNTLWLVLGIIAISFVFVDRNKDEELVYFFKLVTYLGLISVLTIVSATTCNLWFKNKIRDQIIHDFDPTSYKFLRYVAVFSICYAGLILFLIAFPAFRTIVHTALGGAGVVVVIAGVASQEALSNIVGGVFIIAFKPFKINDVIKISDTMGGKVVDITMRHTIIKDSGNKMIVIPNSIINKEKLINYDLGESKNCEFIDINITLDSNIDLAKIIIQEECEKHPLIYDNRSEIQKNENQPIVKTALIKFNDNTMTLRAWTWSPNYSDSFTLKTNVFESIKKRFDIEGIKMYSTSSNVVVKYENSI